MGGNTTSWYVGGYITHE